MPTLIALREHPALQRQPDATRILWAEALTQLEATKNLQNRLTVVGVTLSVIITVVSLITALTDLL